MSKKFKYDLVLFNDPVLKEPCEKFDFSNPPLDPVELSRDLVDTMRAHNGIGLSANQVGLNYRVFVMMGDPYYACFNPRIVGYGNETIVLEEGCLTYPGLYVPIKRPRAIRCRFTMPNGQTVTKTFDGLTSRCFQHEIDHMDGVNFLRRANAYHRERALKRWKRELKHG